MTESALLYVKALAAGDYKAAGEIVARLAANIAIAAATGEGGALVKSAVVGERELAALKVIEKAEKTSNGTDNSFTAAGLKLDLKTTQAANDIVESLRATGQLPSYYVNKSQAAQQGWAPGKALNNTVPAGQIGGDVFANSTNLLPSQPGRTWFEADIGLNNTMSRSNQPGMRLLYSSDVLLYVTTDHYKSATPIGKWR